MFTEEMGGKKQAWKMVLIETKAVVENQEAGITEMILFFFLN